MHQPSRLVCSASSLPRQWLHLDLFLLPQNTKSLRQTLVCFFLQPETHFHWHRLTCFRLVYKRGEDLRQPLPVTSISYEVNLALVSREISLGQSGTLALPRDNWGPCHHTGTSGDLVITSAYPRALALTWDKGQQATLARFHASEAKVEDLSNRRWRPRPCHTVTLTHTLAWGCDGGL